MRASKHAVAALSTRFALIELLLCPERCEDINGSRKSSEMQKVLFMEMVCNSLWGNASDLSLHPNLTASDIQKLQAQSRSKQENIISNDLELVYAHLATESKNSQSNGRVDIVLDNAGFELFVDLLLAAYLVKAGLAKSVVLHPKGIPWFVSDVTERDFTDLIETLIRPEYSFQRQQALGVELNGGSETLPGHSIASIRALGHLLQRMAEAKQIILREDEFWTRGCSFWSIKAVAPKLFKELQASDLVVFKGDLNYRKLTGDARWDPITSFSRAIGPLGAGSGVQVLALRTCKADVVVGLSAGKDEELRHQTGMDTGGKGREWAWNGDWAVAQFSDGT